MEAFATHLPDNFLERPRAGGKRKAIVEDVDVADVAFVLESFEHVASALHAAGASCTWSRMGVASEDMRAHVQIKLFLAISGMVIKTLSMHLIGPKSK